MENNSSLLTKKITALTAAALMGVIPLMACENGESAKPAASLSASASPKLNNATFKQFGFNGYEIVDDLHINLAFNKGITTAPPIALISVSTGGGANLVGSFTMLATGGDGCEYTSPPYGCNGGIYSASPNLENGSTIQVTLNSAMATNATYKVTISNFLMDGAGGSGISFGNFGPYTFDNTGKNPVSEPWSFNFQTPSSFSTWTWSGTPATPTYNVWSTSSPESMTVESNVVIVFDRPVSASTLSPFLTNLDSGYTKGGTPVDQITPTETYGAVSNNGGFTANDNTTFEFPLTVAATGNEYNRTFGGTYTLAVPTFTGINGTTVSPSGITFTTMGGDLPGTLTAPTATDSSGEITVSWSATTETGCGSTTGYNIYVSAPFTTDPTSSYMYGAYTYVTSVAYPATSVSFSDSSYNKSYNYYFTVVPYNSYGVVGFAPPSELVW